MIMSSSFILTSAVFYTLLLVKVARLDLFVIDDLIELFCLSLCSLEFCIFCTIDKRTWCIPMSESVL